MKGEAKRDYPASISHQSAWYHQYRYVEDYYSRLHVMLGLGESLCELLVVSPVESAWASIYPNWSFNLGATDGDIQEIEHIYADTFRLLCGYKIDFDYGDEGYIEKTCEH